MFTKLISTHRFLFEFFFNLVPNFKMDFMGWFFALVKKRQNTKPAKPSRRWSVFQLLILGRSQLEQWVWCIYYTTLGSKRLVLNRILQVFASWLTWIQNSSNKLVICFRDFLRYFTLWTENNNLGIRQASTI